MKLAILDMRKSHPGWSLQAIYLEQVKDIRYVEQIPP